MRISLRAVGTITLISITATNVAAGDVSIQDAAVERVDGRVVVHWQSIPRDAPIDVSLRSPGQPHLRLVSDNDRDGHHELSAADAARRPLIHLQTASGTSLVTAERLLPLQGGRNFRDLGGYETIDGRRVKWGLVYRSGTMTDLTDSDYQLLSTLGIRVVCDFRANEEREREPTLWRTSGSKAEYRSRDYAAESSRLAELLVGTPQPEKVRAAMMDTYRDLPYEHAESYRTMFKALAAGQAPLAFNCSAGKDRTGVAAALLLTMLGVPRETIVEDYALSEKVVNYEAQYSRPQGSATAKPGPWDFILELPPEVRAPLLRSEPDYIRTALTHVEQQEGSIDAYFERVLEVSAAERRSIRQLLLH